MSSPATAGWTCCIPTRVSRSKARLEQVTPDQMDASWVLNVRSHFVAARAVIGQMRAQGGGSIIVTASNSGVQYDAGMIAYATTKHAAVAMVKQMAKDYAGDSIRVNALCPGFIDTPFNAGFERQMGGRDTAGGLCRGNHPDGSLRHGGRDRRGDCLPGF